MAGPIAVAECDETQEHFVYHSWHCSAYERRLCDKGLCYYIPMVFHNNAAYYEYFLDVNVVMVSVAPMDKHGYFNFSVNTGVAAPIARMADIVIVEVNENLPQVRGGYDECIHISDVDYIVEGEHEPFVNMEALEPTEIDRQIAKYLIPHIVDGATLQLGIGSMPNALGEIIAKSDLKDLGMHTELCSDAYLQMYLAGKLTNRKKKLEPGKGVFGCAIGSNALYEWLDDNPGVAAYPLEYVNRPSVIAQIDHMVSINSCVAVDLYGQVAAESSGVRQISGTGGQLDFLIGASASRGGKAFICMSSVYVDKDGQKKTPVVLHRAILGSLDRFMAYILEETKGNLPLWLAPVQAMILPVKNDDEELNAYAHDLYGYLLDNNIRADIDERAEKLGYRVREAQVKKIPYLIILGKQEAQDGTVSYRLHGQQNTTTVSRDEFLAMLKDEIATKKLSK